ncbi:MAG: IS630 family transposase [Zavarzinella sp.]
MPGHGWTIRKLCNWIGCQFQRYVSRNTVRRILQLAGLSWKKCKKLFGKGDPEKRAEYLKQFADMYQQMCRGDIVIIYIDESHFHRDMDLGYTWWRKGESAWRVSDCPPLSDRINWYGAYNFSAGACLIWNEGKCNKENTAEFLHRVNDWVERQGRRVVVIWDGAPWHKAKFVRTKASELDIEIVVLPSYSPDFNPIEGLWKWMREEVTQHCCFATLRDLFDACKGFIDTLNETPDEIIKRLWPRFEVDPQAEKLRFSI